MSGFRIALGGAILMLVVVPMFMAVVWATGVTQAIFGDSFLAGIHDTVIDEVPGIVDDAWAAAQEEGAIKNPEAKVWVAAMAGVGQTPSQFLKNAGIYDWLKGELGTTIDEVGETLRGERDPETVVLDLWELKRALGSAEARAYYQAILDQLPPCKRDDLEQWKSIAIEQRKGDLPACNPGAPIPAGAVELMLVRTTDMPEKVPVFQHNELPWGADYLSMTGSVVWAAFFLPIIFLLIGGAIVGVSRPAFLGWSGATLILGGGMPWLSTTFIQEIAVHALRVDPSRWKTLSKSPFWTTNASHALAKRIANLADTIVGQIFEPVATIGLVVAGIGLVLVVLAFLAPGRQS